MLGKVSAVYARLVHIRTGYNISVLVRIC